MRLLIDMNLTYRRASHLNDAASGEPLVPEARGEALLGALRDCEAELGLEAIVALFWFDRRSPGRHNEIYASTHPRARSVLIGIAVVLSILSWSLVYALDDNHAQRNIRGLFQPQPELLLNRREDVRPTGIARSWRRTIGATPGRASASEPR